MNFPAWNVHLAFGEHPEQWVLFVNLAMPGKIMHITKMGLKTSWG